MHAASAIIILYIVYKFTADCEIPRGYIYTILYVCMCFMWCTGPKCCTYICLHSSTNVQDSLVVSQNNTECLQNFKQYTYMSCNMHWCKY